MLFRIHLGVHKTASTHLQNILALEQDALRRQGVTYIPRGEFRRSQLSRLMRGNGFAKFLPPGPRQVAVDRLLREQHGVTDTVLISEENIIGVSADCLNGQLFPRVERKLNRLLSALETNELCLYMAIRNPVTFFPSIYAQVLRRNHIPGGFDALGHAVSKSTPSWSNLVRRIKQTAPHAKLHVWTFETYKDAPELILEALTGCAGIGNISVPIPPQTKSASATAIHEVEKLPRYLPASTYRKRVQHLLDEDDDRSRFRGFSEDQAARLNDIYFEDIEAIKRMDVVFIE